MVALILLRLLHIKTHSLLLQSSILWIMTCNISIPFHNRKFLVALKAFWWIVDGCSSFTKSVSHRHLSFFPRKKFVILFQNRTKLHLHMYADHKDPYIVTYLFSHKIQTISCCCPRAAICIHTQLSQTAENIRKVCLNKKTRKYW